MGEESRGDAGSIPGSERAPKGRNGNQLQYSYLKNPMDGGPWQATVQRVMQRVRLSNLAQAEANTGVVAPRPGTRVESVSPALVGGFFTTTPGGKLLFLFY